MPSVFSCSGFPPCLPIAGTHEVFAVGQIYCVGKNYAEHVAEMGDRPETSEPVFFMKPGHNAILHRSVLPFPRATNCLHHEIELVVALRSGGGEINEDEALQHVFGYAVGLDLTRRDLQGLCKERRGPWEVAKSFPGAAPLTSIHRVDQVGHPTSGRIWLEVNGSIRQSGDLSQMIYPIPRIIAALSRYFDLSAGDLIMTGTPSGVGQLLPGDQVQGGIDGIPETLSLTMGTRD